MGSKLDIFYQKHEIKQALLAAIFKKEFESLDAELDNILLLNSIAIGNHHSVIRYRGKYYTFGMDSPSLYKSKYPIEKNLIPQMNAYLMRKQKTVLDLLVKIEAYIANLLNCSNNPADYLLLLPNCLHSVIVKEFRSRGIEVTQSQATLSKEEVDKFLVIGSNIGNLIKQKFTRELLM